jgi:hypothetical protein
MKCILVSADTGNAVCCSAHIPAPPQQVYVQTMETFIGKLIFVLASCARGLRDFGECISLAPISSSFLLRGLRFFPFVQ